MCATICGSLRKYFFKQVLGKGDEGKNTMKWKYILKRILIAIPTFFGITILAYFILNMAPGSPLDALLADPGITPAELERKRVAL